MDIFVNESMSGRQSLDLILTVWALSSIRFENDWILFHAYMGNIMESKSVIDIRHDSDRLHVDTSQLIR